MRSILLLVAMAAALDAQTTPTSLEWKDRWDGYVDRTFNWRYVAPVAAESILEQSFQLNRCGRPPYCFPHHVGGALARRTTRTTIELGAGALLGEDIRRRPSELTGFGERVRYALKHAVLAKARDGDWRPAYSRYIGTAAATVVNSAWFGRPLTAGRLGECFLWSASSYFQDALFAEFEPDLRRLGRRTWQRVRPRF